MNTPEFKWLLMQDFLENVSMRHKNGISFKPTQAMEDGINAGLLTWLLEGTQFKIGRRWAVNAYDEHKENVDKINCIMHS